MNLDAEDRANRLHNALDGLASLFAMSPPGLMLDSEKTGSLLALMAEEAAALARCHEPRHAAGAND